MPTWLIWAMRKRSKGLEGVWSMRLLKEKGVRITNTVEPDIDRTPGLQIPSRHFQQWLGRRAGDQTGLYAQPEARRHRVHALTSLGEHQSHWLVAVAECR